MSGIKIVEINLTEMSPSEAADELLKYGIVLPGGFDFRQHVRLVIDTEAKQVIEVEKLA